MLGNDGRLYDPHFDHDKDGKLNTYERAMYDDSFNNDASGSSSNPARMNGGLYSADFIMASL